MKAKLFTLIVVMGLILAGCTPQPTTTAPAPEPTNAPGAAPTKAEAQATSAPAATQAPEKPGEPVTLHIGWLGVPDTLNPAYAFLVESYTIFDLVYTPLTTESPSGEYVGGLAKEWKHSEDGLTWTFTLKDGIQWHNGEAFKAEDMAWTINAIIADPDGWAALSNYVAGFKEAKALDDQTLEITLEEPIGNLEYRLSFVYAVYPKDFEGFTTPEDLQNFNNFELTGTGAFKMKTFEKDQGILILEANRDYFDTPAKIDEVIFQTFDNADAMVQALKVGDIDLVSEVPASAFETVKGFENVTAISPRGRYFAELILNSTPADNDPAPTKNPALDDPQVRLAIATAINKTDLVDIVLQNLGEPGDSIVPPTLGGGFWHSPNIQDVLFDIDAANTILEDAGYVMGSDGVRAKGDLRLEFRLQFPSDNPLYPRVADLMTDWFKQAGIKTNPESVDPDSLVALTTPAGDYDLVIWGWGPDPDPDFILSVMTSEQFVDGGWSDSGYMNPEYDQLYLDQQVAVDKDERQKIVWKMQEMVFNDRPYIVLWYEDLLQAYRTDRFTGFIESALGIEISLSLVQVEPVK
ncbi:MAG: ABC transporter substrate-binding protein [Chloroflexota bacterium]